MREVRISEYDIDRKGPEWSHQAAELLRHSPYSWEVWQDHVKQEVVLRIDMPEDHPLPILI